MKGRSKSVIVKLPHPTKPKGDLPFMNNITQDMKYKQSLIQFALKYGVSRASRKFNRSRSFIYFWLNRYDGSIQSLACYSRKPNNHPNQHTNQELKLIRDFRRRNPSLGMVELWCRLLARGYSRSLGGLYRVLRKLGYTDRKKIRKKSIPKPYQQMTHPGERIQIDVKIVPKSCLSGDAKQMRLVQYSAIDEFSRLRFIAAYQEQNTYSSTDFLKRAVAFFRQRGIYVQCVQTDNGTEFTNRFIPSRRQLKTLFEKTASELGIYHKLIRPYTPRHNGKVERSHREDQKRFYSTHSFFSFADFEKQLNSYRSRSNNIPMRPLGYRSPLAFLYDYNVQYV